MDISRRVAIKTGLGTAMSALSLSDTFWANWLAARHIQCNIAFNGMTDLSGKNDLRLAPFPEICLAQPHVINGAIGTW